MTKFAIRLQKTGAIVARHGEFFPIKAMVLRLMAQHPMGTFELVVQDGAQWFRACLGCGKNLHVNWRTRCLVCSAVGATTPPAANGGRGFRIR